jgi:ACS family hexuronate transporter-like MFS transporter
MLRNRYRWLVCGLLVLATIINYVDRQVLAMLSASPDFQRITGFGTVEYGYAHSVFQLAYAVALPLVGRLVDRVGTRLGYLIIMAFWSLADMAHALASGARSFFAARFALGLGEAGCFPTNIKTIAEWFPRRERALATGWLNAGASVGALIAPLLVPYIYAHHGWRWCFLLTGLVGFVWMIAWARLAGPPGAHPRVSESERSHILSDRDLPASALGWREILGRRQTWGIVLAKGLTDPIWMFYLAWLPRLLADRHGMTIGTVSWPLAAIYLLSDAGSVAGGWLAGRLIARGNSVAGARRTVMLIAALLPLPMLQAGQATGLPALVALVGLATAAHQAWSSNLFSLASDLFPRTAVARVVGLAGAAGSVGAVLFHAVTGHIVNATGSYQPLLVAAALAYLVAWCALRGLLRPARSRLVAG